MRVSAITRTRLDLGLPRTVRSVLSDAGAEPARAEVHGWVRSLRAHKNVAFAEIDDGSGGSVQAVLKGKARDEGLTNGASVHLTGELKPSRGSQQSHELVVSETTVLGACGDKYPVQKKAIPAPVLREYAHLRFRTGSTAAVMRVRDALARDWHDWFEENEFVHVHTPILTSSDCEGAGEVFTIAQSLSRPAPEGSKPSVPPFFPKPVNLTVSGQLHLEAPTHALSRAYTLSPAFRAEPSMTSRHLAEFYMLEAELAFVRGLGQLCDVVEASVRDTLRMLLDSTSRRAVRTREDLGRIAAFAASAEEEAAAASGNPGLKVEPVDRIKALADTAAQPFARITYTDAIAVLEAQHAKEAFTTPPSWDAGLSSEHEKWLSGVHFGRPTFVTHYPAAQKPFYMLPSSACADAPEQTTPGETVAAFDLLFPGIGEMAGGSLREHRLDALMASIAKHDLDEQDYSWYLDLRRFGSVPHGGWGMGWDRWVTWVTGTANIRDVVAFPRWAGSCRF